MRAEKMKVRRANIEAEMGINANQVNAQKNAQAQERKKLEEIRKQNILNKQNAQKKAA